MVEVYDSRFGSKLLHETAHLDALLRMKLLRPYYAWVLRQFHPFVGQRVLDAGAGIGNFTELISDIAEFVLAVDISPLNLSALRARFHNRAQVEVAQLDLETHVIELRDRGIDTVVCLDVLEHIKDDVRLLRCMRELISPGGRLLLKVPAGKWLYGSIDEASGHFRRYDRIELTEKAVQAGWTVERCRHMNLAGVLPYFVKSRILRKRANFSCTFSRWQLSLIRAGIPVIAVLDRLLGPPVGQSLILVAHRPSE